MPPAISSKVTPPCIGSPRLLSACLLSPSAPESYISDQVTTSEGDATERERAFATLGALHQEVARLERELGVEHTGAPPDSRPSNVSEWLGMLLNDYGSDFISVHEPNGDYVYASPSCERLFGWLAEELSGTNAYELFHPDDLARIAKDHAAHAGDEQSIRYRFRCKSGGYRWVETRSRARTTSRGIEQIVCITRDVHEEHEAKLSSRAASMVLAEQERVSIMAGVVAALSHELNNPLMAAMVTLEGISGGPGEAAAIDVARQAVLRMKQVIFEMVHVLQGDWTEQSLVDLAAASERVAALLPRTRPCRIVTEFEPTPVFVTEAVLLQCLYHIAFSHLEGTPAGSPEVVLTLRVHPLASNAACEISSRATELPNRMRADLASIRLGRGSRWAVPMQLAETLADQLKGRIENTLGPEGLTTRLLLPRARASA